MSKNDAFMAGYEAGRKYAMRKKATKKKALVDACSWRGEGEYEWMDDEGENVDADWLDTEEDYKELIDWLESCDGFWHVYYNGE